MASNIFSTKRLIPGRIRSKDFSQEEVRVLVYNFVKYNSILSNKSITDSNLREKNRLYVQITGEVNEVGGQNRREDAIKDKWQNEKRRVRFKAMKLVEKQKQSLLDKGEISSKNDIITLTDDVISKYMSEEEAWVLSVMPVEYYQPDYVNNSQEGHNFFSFENTDQSQLSISSSQRESHHAIQNDASANPDLSDTTALRSPRTVIKLSDSPVSVHSNSENNSQDNLSINNQHTQLQNNLQNLNCTSLGRLATLFTLPLGTKPFDSINGCSTNNHDLLQDYSRRNSSIVVEEQQQSCRRNTKLKTRAEQGNSLNKQRRVRIEEEKLMLLRREFHFKRKYYTTKTRYLNTLLQKESHNERMVKVEEQKVRLQEQELACKRDFYEAKGNYYRSLTNNKTAHETEHSFNMNTDS